MISYFPLSERKDRQLKVGGKEGEKERENKRKNERESKIYRKQQSNLFSVRSFKGMRGNF